MVSPANPEKVSIPVDDDAKTVRGMLSLAKFRLSILQSLRTLNRQRENGDRGSGKAESSIDSTFGIAQSPTHSYLATRAREREEVRAIFIAMLCLLRPPSMSIDNRLVHRVRP